MPLLAHHAPAAAPQGPPVVMLHGFASSFEKDFAGWSSVLNTVGRSALGIELPGHGGNPSLTTETGTDATVNQILTTIDRYSPATQIDVVGYSLGARLAWELPRKNPRVRRLALGGLSPTEPFIGVTAAALLTAVEGEPTTPENPIIEALATMISAPGRDTASLAYLAAGLGREPFTPTSAPLDRPTLFISGDEDPMSRGIDDLLAAAPCSELEVIPGDHLGALASPSFRAAAVAFLSR